MWCKLKMLLFFYIYNLLVALQYNFQFNNIFDATEWQAESLTGIGDPILAGQELLKRGIRTKWVIVKMGLKGSFLITTSSIVCAPAFKVTSHSEFSLNSCHQIFAIMENNDFPNYRMPLCLILLWHTLYYEFHRSKF